LTYNVGYPVTYAFHEEGIRTVAEMTAFNSTQITPRGTSRMQFIIPIYSGILGLLMPEKKLLPLNLLPLDIEITFNRTALYSSKKTNGSRAYVVKDFYIYGNTFFFE
jgi:hypothetical protein